MTDQLCDACGGLGWLLQNNDLHGLRVERCDTCCALKTDADAAAEALPLLQLANAAGRRNKLRAWRAQRPPPAPTTRRTGACGKAFTRHCLGGEDEPGQRVRIRQCYVCGEDVCRPCSGQRAHFGKVVELCNDCWVDYAVDRGDRIARELTLIREEHRLNHDPVPDDTYLLTYYFTEEDREHYESARRRPAAPPTVG